MFMKKVISTLLMACSLLLCAQVSATPVSVLWWDSTPEYSGQASNALRQEMSDYLTNFGGGGVFDSTYVGSEVAGTLAAQLASNSYDVIVFDATSSGSKFNADDLLAVQNHYATKSNLMLDGTLYIRNINYNGATDFPGPNGAMGGLLVNQINQLATRGGGMMIGTDHNGFQFDANQILNSVIAGASFTGNTTPSTDGVFYGSDLLNDAVAIAAADVFTHWSAVASEGIAPTGTYTDINNNSVTLYSQVDVADAPGGGTKYSYISTSWAPGSGVTQVDDETVGGTGGGTNVPEPGSLFLFLGALVGIAARRKLQ
jgi:hypothetical protein